ncbi:DUF983 domain-containing protein [Pelagimonas varians]|uniref:DUF983 domain-containing protein n=1 Tax=Pelagimonas varians TaxID=696760 RepID=A0A238KIE4_9RHOB|nr:DUF983 domain-containing protein [Pelagimonas varians]PYG32314.1 uncharacterized protein (DUF983 family) [Pelagimonas varians]SMX41876.1 hypothetical protein PEV8663_02368 [Pelagimonas varians]
MTQANSQILTDQPERSVKRAIGRGLLLRCPDCGKGAILHSYLKVNETCDCCGLELSRAKADDGPAYLTILIVGHIVGFAMHFSFVTWRPEPITMVTIGLTLAITSSLIMLPRMKGLIIGFQWAKRMYGF